MSHISICLCVKTNHNDIHDLVLFQFALLEAASYNDPNAYEESIMKLMQLLETLMDKR